MLDILWVRGDTISALMMIFLKANFVNCFERCSFHQCLRALITMVAPSGQSDAASPDKENIFSPSSALRTKTAKRQNTDKTLLILTDIVSVHRHYVSVYLEMCAFFFATCSAVYVLCSDKARLLRCVCEMQNDGEKLP